MVRFRKSALTATTTFAAMAAAVVLAAPNATAYVSNVSVASGNSIGLGSAQYGTNCSHTVTVEGSAWESVWLYSTNAGTFNPQSFNLGSSGRATSTWTPSNTGWTGIHAWSYGGDRWTWVNVGTGINLGSACVVR
ncbi:hypothetical protein [Nocardia sp. NPDC050406]|uniref:hypothetical protein n=1 Tax=Nocardia sp. NPDC050406 TaxID=3364318 RepID=UPI0037BDFE41